MRVWTNHEQALTDYSRAIELDRYEPEAIRLRAALYSSKKETKRAIADYERLIELNPCDARWHRGLANALLVRGEESKAIAALSAAWRWEPQTRLIFADILDYGTKLTSLWPDDPAKRAMWYEQALRTIGPVSADQQIVEQIEAVLRSKKSDEDVKTFGNRLEDCVKRLVN